MDEVSDEAGFGLNRVPWQAGFTGPRAAQLDVVVFAMNVITVPSPHSGWHHPATGSVTR